MTAISTLLVTRGVMNNVSKEKKMKTNSNSTSKTTEASKAAAGKARLAAFSETPPTTTKPRASSKSNTTSAPVADAPTPKEGTASAAPTFKSWRIEKLSDIAEVDAWFQDKLIHILNHLLRKARILKRRLVGFTYPEKGIVEITWQDIATGEIIIEGGAGGVAPPADDEDPLA
jgi:hypothetical protein